MCVSTATVAQVLTKRGTVFRLLSTDFEAMQTVAMGIRQLKPPETYTGKGVVFWGETVVKKEGKKK
jgi:ribosomal protein L6P/L9E